MTERDRVNIMGSGIFEIPEANLKKFEAALEKLSRKAVKLGGEPFLPVVFSYKMVEIKKGQAIKVFEVLIDCTIPQIDGWEFIGRIDHANGEVGNLVRALPNREIPEKYRHSGCKCDHCNINRFRRDTYILQNIETGETKQVGSSCLKDFLGGNDPVKLAKMAELLSYARECARGYTNYVGEDRRYLVLQDFLEYVALSMHIVGYFVSRKMAGEKQMQSTDGDAFGMMHNTKIDYGRQITDKERELASKTIEWAAALSESDKQLTDYEHNISVLAASGAIEYRSSGYAASMINAYQVAKGTRPELVRKTSAHVGEKGKKLVFEGILKQATATNGRFPGIRYGFEDDAGNLMVWFTGQNVELDKGERYRVSCKVKDHSEYNNVKSTIVSHCATETV